MIAQILLMIPSTCQGSEIIVRLSGEIDHPEEGTYTLTYGEAVDLGYCRPATFHRHEGKFIIDLDGGDSVEVSSQNPAELTPDLKRIPGLQSSLDFYRLASKPKYKSDGTTPIDDSYQGTIDNKLETLKNYKFSIAIENTRNPEYFTEKIIIPLL